LGGRGGGKSTMDIRKYNLRSSEVRKGGGWQDWFEPALLYLQHFPHFGPSFFYLPLFKSAAKIKLFFGRRNIEGGEQFPYPPSKVTPLFTAV